MISSIKESKHLWLMEFVLLILFIQGCGQKGVANEPIIAARESPKEYLVSACDTNSSVTNSSKKMTVPTAPLLFEKVSGQIVRYKLIDHQKTVHFFCRSDTNSTKEVWLDGMTRHCFALKPNCDITFDSYTFYGGGVEIYGKLKWKKYYRNFRVIFNPGDDVLWDFDDDICLVNKI